MQSALLRLPIRARLRLSGVPAGRAKGRILAGYGRRYGLGTLIETGTFQGDTVAACLSSFERIYSIELDEAFHRAAVERFAADPSVTLIHGDSYAELRTVAATVSEPALFWLDAHYCERETARGPHDPPLPWELRTIVKRGKRDVILVDDARLMGVNPGYPSIDEIRELAGARCASFDVRRDIIRIVLGAADASDPAVTS